MDIKKVFPLLFESTAGCEKLLSLDAPKVAGSIDDTLVPDYPFGNQSNINLNHCDVHLPKQSLEKLQQLFEDFNLIDETIQINLKYCLVSMMNAKYLGFTSTNDGINEEATFFSTGGHKRNKLSSITFKSPKKKSIVISSKSILAQIQQILAQHEWEDEDLDNDLEAANLEKKIIKRTGSNSLLDAKSKYYFFAIYNFLESRINGENNKKGIAQMMLYIVDFKNINPVLVKFSAIDAGKKTFKRNKGGQLKF